MKKDYEPIPYSTIVIVFILVSLCVLPYATGWNLEYLQPLSNKVSTPLCFLIICIVAGILGFCETQVKKWNRT